MMKLILILTALFSMSVFSQVKNSCLFNLEVGGICELGMDTVTPIEVMIANLEDFKELLSEHRQIMKLTVSKEKALSAHLSDQQVFTVNAATCMGFMGNVCVNKAKLVIKRYYDTRLMDATIYTYDSSGVIKLD